MLIFFFSYCPTFQLRSEMTSSFPFQEHCHDSQTPISCGLYFVQKQTLIREKKPQKLNVSICWSCLKLFYTIEVVLRDMQSNQHYFYALLYFDGIDQFGNNKSYLKCQVIYQYERKIKQYTFPLELLYQTLKRWLFVFLLVCECVISCLFNKVLC